MLLQPVEDGDLVTQEPADHNKISEYKYNSFNQIIWSNTPDAGVTLFYYDNLQRMRFSQNARQLALSTPRFSYTKYDDLSRVIEVGECEVSENQVIANINNAQWPNTIIDNIPTFDPVFTTYSEAVTSGFNHGVSRGRVAKVTRRNDPKDLNDDPVDITTLYRYDVHGNVNRIQQVIFENLTSEIEYNYDLISGNVKTVSYNRNKYDAFYHKYSYDADNRLERVYTSQDRVIWNEDARYFYYLHGPLARVEYGDQKVQGLDYAYTMQGWIKTVNDAGKTAETEPGSDGFAHATNRNRWMGRDASAYTLGYFSNDYVSGTTLGMQPSIFAGEHQGLYNGNIAAMMTEHKGVGFDEAVSVYGYTYDQLHRIKKGTHYNFLNNSYSLSRKYDTEYTYDPDGNLEDLQRTGNQMATLMDNLSYHYGLPDKPNQLTQVIDAATDANPGQFIGQEMYEYDDIGNLTKNTSNGVITDIDWDVYNKVKQVTDDDNLIRFIYDGAGNRVLKYKNVGIENRIPVISGYIRDASGNTMAVYDASYFDQYNYGPPLQEMYIFGSSRIGVDKTVKSDSRNSPPTKWHKDLTTTRYEITNHLGNVLSTVTGRKLGIEDGVGLLDYYLPEVVTATDYYAFGQTMPGRTYENPDYTGTNDYRYAFNGKELDKSGEFGSLSHYDYGFRIFNPAIGKFLSVDPLASKYPSISPYAYAANNPIYYIDPDGRYILPAALAQKYSKLASYLQNGMGTLLQNEKIRSGLRLMGNFTDSQIDQLGKYDEGITINLKQLDNDEVDHPQSLEKNGDAWTSGYSINIDETLALQLQNSSTPQEEAGALLGIVSTILHETVHKGENGFGKGNNATSDGLFSKESFYNKRTGDESFYYYFSNIGIGSNGDSGKAFENAIWDFGGNLSGMKQGQQGKIDQTVRYFLNYYFNNQGVLPKTD